MANDENQLANWLSAGMLSLPVFALLAAVWMTVKSIELVKRMVDQHPNPALWLSLALTLGCVGLAAYASFEDQAMNIAAAVSVVVTVILAKFTETGSADTFTPELSRETMAHSIMEEPWWEVAEAA